MKSWHTWMIALAIGCAAQAGPTNVNGEPADQAEPGNMGLFEELAAAIAEIEADFLDADERAQRIAILIARATRSNPMGTAPVLASLSRGLTPENLSVVSAAAIMSSGTSSPAVLRALVDAQGEDAIRTEAVRLGAVNPVAILGRRTAGLMRPAGLDPLADPLPASRPSATAARTRASGQVAPAAVPTPAPAPAVAEINAAVTSEISPAPIEVAAAVSSPVESAPPPQLASMAQSEPLPSQPPLVSQSMGAQPPPPQPPGLPPRPPALPYRGQ